MERKERKRRPFSLSLFSLLCIGVIKIWETGGLYLLDGSRKTRTLASRRLFSLLFGSTKKLVVVGAEGRIYSYNWVKCAMKRVQMLMDSR